MGLMLWFLKRVTAICMALYATFIYNFFSHNPFTFVSFQAFFHTPSRAALFLLTATAISVHALIGVWTIATDYLKCRCVRYTALSLYSGLLGFAWLSAALSVGGLL